jgi:hypothetical protein
MPKISEYFPETKMKAFDQTIPNKTDYENMVDLTQGIKNKSTVNFKILDMPDILNFNSVFL